MKNKIKYLSVSTLTLTTVLSGAVLASSSAVADSGSTNVSVSVGEACVFTGTSSSVSNLAIYSDNVVNTESDTSKNNSVVRCNIPNGFTVQAVGYSPDATHPEGAQGNTSMYSISGTILTSAPTSDGHSYWGFKVTSANSSTSTATITPSYASYSAVPSSPTTILTVPSSTSGNNTASFRTDYQVYANTRQTVGIYTGAVKYIIATGA